MTKVNKPYHTQHNQTHMDITKKGKPTRLLIYEVDEPLLEKLCENTGLTTTDVLSKIVHAGLVALEENGYRMSLPLRFSLSDSPERTKPPTQIRR